MPRPPLESAGTCASIGTAPAHEAPSAPIRNPKEAQVFAFDSCSKSTRTVGVSSTALRKRNHDSSGTCRTNRGAISLKSTAMNPNPPPCKSKSVARKLCSIFLQRTHKSFRSSTPAASAECGSKASAPSIKAQASSCAVRALKAESSKLVRPEQEGPKISVNAPRGNPPVNESISGMPVETVVTTLRSRYVKGAATRPAKASSTCERKAAKLAAIVHR